MHGAKSLSSFHDQRHLGHPTKGELGTRRILALSDRKGVDLLGIVITFSFVVSSFKLNGGSYKKAIHAFYTSRFPLSCQIWLFPVPRRSKAGYKTTGRTAKEGAI